MPEAIMSEILRRLLRGHTYKGANGITAKLLDMSKVDDLAETTSLTDLLANAETEYDKYVTDVSVQGGSVAVMLDPARQLVEREYALRLAEYQQKYRDSSLAEEMASMICGTCNVITTPQGKGGSTDSSVSASSGKFPRMCLNCEGTCSNLAACPQKHCGICQKLHANSKLVHNDPKKPRQCPLFPYALKHYRDTGSLPTKRSFFAAYKVPDELSQRAFPDSKGAANSKGDKSKGDSKANKKKSKSSTGSSSATDTAPSAPPATSGGGAATATVASRNPAFLPVSGHPSVNVVHGTMMFEGRSVPVVISSPSPSSPHPAINMISAGVGLSAVPIKEEGPGDVALAMYASRPVAAIVTDSQVSSVAVNATPPLVSHIVSPTLSVSSTSDSATATSAISTLDCVPESHGPSVSSVLPCVTGIPVSIVPTDTNGSVDTATFEPEVSAISDVAGLFLAMGIVAVSVASADGLSDSSTGFALSAVVVGTLAAWAVRTLSASPVAPLVSAGAAVAPSVSDILVGDYAYRHFRPCAFDWQEHTRPCPRSFKPNRQTFERFSPFGICKLRLHERQQRKAVRLARLRAASSLRYTKPPSLPRHVSPATWRGGRRCGGPKRRPQQTPVELNVLGSAATRWRAPRPALSLFPTSFSDVASPPPWSSNLSQAPLGYIFLWLWQFMVLCCFGLLWALAYGCSLGLYAVSSSVFGSLACLSDLRAFLCHMVASVAVSTVFSVYRTWTGWGLFFRTGCCSLLFAEGVGGADTAEPAVISTSPNCTAPSSVFGRLFDWFSARPAPLPDELIHDLNVTKSTRSQGPKSHRRDHLAQLKEDSKLIDALDGMVQRGVEQEDVAVPALFALISRRSYYRRFRSAFPYPSFSGDLTQLRCIMDRVQDIAEHLNEDEEVEAMRYRRQSVSQPSTPGSRPQSRFEQRLAEHLVEMGSLEQMLIHRDGVLLAHRAPCMLAPLTLQVVEVGNSDTESMSESDTESISSGSSASTVDVSDLPSDWGDDDDCGGGGGCGIHACAASSFLRCSVGYCFPSIRHPPPSLNYSDLALPDPWQFDFTCTGYKVDFLSPSLPLSTAPSPRVMAFSALRTRSGARGRKYAEVVESNRDVDQSCDDLKGLLDSGADVSITVTKAALDQYIERQGACLSANGSAMHIEGLGDLPHGLGPAHYSADLSTHVDVVISIPTLQQMGYSVIFHSGSGVTLLDVDNRVVLESDTAVVLINDYNQNPTEEITLERSTIPPPTVNTISRLFPIGVPNTWRRAAHTAADLMKRQSLVNFAHRLTHTSLDSMLRNAATGMYDHLGLTADHIRATPPICSSCAVKKLKRRPKNKVETPDQVHTSVGDVISVDQFFMTHEWPKARGNIHSVFTTIDAFSGYVHPFPVHGTAKTWTSDWVVEKYKQLISIYKLWAHHVKIIRSDNDPVLVSQTVQTWATNFPLALQHGSSGSHEQNGLIERFNGYLRAWVDTVYHDMDHIPLSLWYYVILAGILAWNTTLHGDRTCTP